MFFSIRFRWKASAENIPVTADSQLIIHGIPKGTSRQDLMKCFSTFGGITALRSDDRGRMGFLNFSSAEAVKLALISSPHQINGNDLQVSWLKPSWFMRCFMERIRLSMKARKAFRFS